MTVDAGRICRRQVHFMIDIPWLQPDDYSFPNTDTALPEPNGLLAIGGDLNPDRLINAYRKGIFPWYEDPQPILWWSPSPRAVLFPAQFYLSRSLRKRLKKHDYRISCDTAFTDVMQACASTERNGQSGTWITPLMLEAYTKLHTLGLAHSIEVWIDDQLAGGLYGIAIGRIFFGESMFSHCTNGSKIALAYLSCQLQDWGFAMIDCQVSTSHLFSLGAQEISRAQFSQILAENIDQKGPQQWPRHWHHSF